MNADERALRDACANWAELLAALLFWRFTDASPQLHMGQLLGSAAQEMAAGGGAAEANKGFLDFLQEVGACDFLRGVGFQSGAWSEMRAARRAANPPPHIHSRHPSPRQTPSSSLPLTPLQLLLLASRLEVQGVVRLATNSIHCGLWFVAHAYDVLRGYPRAEALFSKPLPHLGCDQVGGCVCVCVSSVCAFVSV